MNSEDRQVTPFDKLRANLTYGTGSAVPFRHSRKLLAGIQSLFAYERRKKKT